MAFCHGVLPWKMRICRGRAGTHAKHREVVSCADSGRTDAAGLQGSPGDSKNWKDFASYGEAMFRCRGLPHFWRWQSSTATATGAHARACCRGQGGRFPSGAFELSRPGFKISRLQQVPAKFLCIQIPIFFDCCHPTS
eukprot:scaffold97444_cov80-Phaeocystis_antarctica.AAC.5